MRPKCNLQDITVYAILRKIAEVQVESSTEAEVEKLIQGFQVFQATHV